MTGFEIAAISVIAGLVGAGGGIWVGNRGKVHEKHCAANHNREAERHVEIRATLAEIKALIEADRAEHGAIYSRINDQNERIARVEAKMNGGHQ